MTNFNHSEYFQPKNCPPLDKKDLLGAGTGIIPGPPLVPGLLGAADDEPLYWNWLREEPADDLENQLPGPPELKADKKCNKSKKHVYQYL